MQQKHATCFATLLQNVLIKAMLRVSPSTFKTSVLQQIRLLQVGWILPYDLSECKDILDDAALVDRIQMVYLT